MFEWPCDAVRMVAEVRRLRDVETLAEKPWPNSTHNRNSAHPDAVWYTGAALRDALRPTVADRTPAQIGKANREAGKRAERKVAQYLEAHGLGNGRRNLAGYARAPRRRRPRHRPRRRPVGHRDQGTGVAAQPGQVEAWAVEAAREASHAGGAPVGADRAPAGVR